MCRSTGRAGRRRQARGLRAAVGNGLPLAPASSGLAASKLLGQEEQIWAPSTASARHCSPCPTLSITATSCLSPH